MSTWTEDWLPAGIRLVSDSKHELLQMVPQSLVDVFRIGSTSPGASFQPCGESHLLSQSGRILSCYALTDTMHASHCWLLQGPLTSLLACMQAKNLCVYAGALLFDARSLYDQKSPKADELLRGILDSLPEAVATCTDAAGAELDPVRQAALLRVCALNGTLAVCCNSAHVCTRSSVCLPLDYTA